jgi:molecular chaperone GrpE
MNDEDKKKLNEEIDPVSSEGSDEAPVSAQDSDDTDDVTFVDSTEDGDALPTKDVIKKLREDLKKARAEKEEYLTGWQRAKADYVNLQKELDLARVSSTTLAKEKMLKNLLPALDSFDMAMANKEAWEAVDKNWRMGIEYILQQLTTGLGEAGVTKIDQVGVPFDPNLHQSIETIPTDDESKDHTIEKVLQTGYKIGDGTASSPHGRVVRPARVNVFEYKQ